MKELVCIEQFLNVNKSICEAQIKVNVNMSKIYISGKYWNNTLISDFKATMLTIDKSIHHKYLESLKNLASDVLTLYDRVNSLPFDYNTIGGNTHLLLYTNDFREPHIMICKDDYYNGKKWTWRIIWDNDWRPEDYELLSKSCITTEPKSINELVRNDMISKRTSIISNILSDIEPQSSTVFLSTKYNVTRMTAIHQYLKENKYIDVDEVVGSWLYWFSLQSWQYTKKNPTKIKWIGAAYVLTNVVYILCGNMTKETEQAMKNAFVLAKGKKFQKKTNIDFSKKPYKSIGEKINFAERYIKD